MTLPAAVAPTSTPAAVTTSSTTITTGTPTASVAPSSPYLTYVYPPAKATAAAIAPTLPVGTTVASTPALVYGQAVVQAPTTVKASSVAPPYYAGQPIVPVSSTGISATNLDNDYVQSLYRNVLNRTGRPEEVASWVDQMNSGLSVQAVAQGFVNSSEHRWNEVDSFYQEFLHRTPDPLAAAWTNDLLSGRSEESVAEAILDSPEYQRNHPDPTQFILGLYGDVLGRQAQPGETAVWQADLAAGMSRQQVVADFVDSPEAVDQVIEGYYAEFLHRLPEPVTSTPWAGLLTPGGSASSVAVGILSSTEYVQDSTQA